MVSEGCLDLDEIYHNRIVLYTATSFSVVVVVLRIPDYAGYIDILKSIYLYKLWFFFKITTTSIHVISTN